MYAGATEDEHVRAGEGAADFYALMAASSDTKQQSQLPVPAVSYSSSVFMRLCRYINEFRHRDLAVGAGLVFFYSFSVDYPQLNNANGDPIAYRLSHFILCLASREMLTIFLMNELDNKRFNEKMGMVQGYNPTGYHKHLHLMYEISSGIWAFFANYWLFTGVPVVGVTNAAANIFCKIMIFCTQMLTLLYISNRAAEFDSQLQSLVDDNRGEAGLKAWMWKYSAAFTGVLLSVGYTFAVYYPVLLELRDEGATSANIRMQFALLILSVLASSASVSRLMYVLSNAKDTAESVNEQKLLNDKNRSKFLFVLLTTLLATFESYWLFTGMEVAGTSEDFTPVAKTLIGLATFSWWMFAGWQFGKMYCILHKESNTPMTTESNRVNLLSEFGASKGNLEEPSPFAERNEDPLIASI